jgi:hypothetical protein
MRHSFTLQAIPLDQLTPERLSDLSWLLDDDFDPNSFISLMVLDPVLLVFRDSLSEPRQQFEELTTSPIH